VTLPHAAGTMVLLCGTGFAAAFSLGLVIEGGGGYSTGGYRVLSMNLPSLGDPRGWITTPLATPSSPRW